MENWNHYTKDHPVGGCFGLIIAMLLLIFFGPWIVMHAWQLIAVDMFGAPAMPYWAAFFGTWAVHILTENIRSDKD